MDRTGVPSTVMMLWCQHTVPLAPAAIRLAPSTLLRLTILYHGFLRKTTNMSETTTPSTPTVQALLERIEAVRIAAIEEAIEQCALIATKGYYMDESGSSPMTPMMIAKQIREDAGINFGYQRGEDGKLMAIPVAPVTIEDALGNMLD